MAIPVRTLTSARKRGNPNWGKPVLVVPRFPTEFEMEVNRLGLTTEMYVFSNDLRRWCEHNRNRVYIPEWLLQKWAIVVDVDFGWFESALRAKTAYPGRLRKPASSA